VNLKDMKIKDCSSQRTMSPDAMATIKATPRMQFMTFRKLDNNTLKTVGPDSPNRSLESYNLKRSLASSSVKPLCRSKYRN
jgi:hypothetical protein